MSCRHVYRTTGSALCRRSRLLFQTPAFTFVNEMYPPSLVQKEEGGSVTRLNFALDAASACTVGQPSCGLSLDEGDATHPQRQHARLSRRSFYFLRISIFSFIYFLTSRADLEAASGGETSCRLCRPIKHSRAVCVLRLLLLFFVCVCVIIQRLETYPSRHRERQ